MFDNLDDPKTQLLMMMGLGLLGGAPGQRKNFGADLAHAGLLGMQGYGQAKEGQARAKRQASQDEMQQMQMDQMRQAIQQKQQIGQLGQRAFAPNQNLVPNDDEGNVMPSSAGGGMPEFARGLMGIDPMLGAQFMPKQQGPVRVGASDRLVDPATGKEIVGAMPEKPKTPMVGAVREIKSGGKVLTYEWDGAKWAKIADAPQFKPDGPEKPEKAPLGYRWSGGGLEAIPGGPADTKAGEKAEALAKRETNALSRADFVIDAADKAINFAKSKTLTTGIAGGVMQNLKGSDAFRLNKLIDPIRANIGFAELQAMREASPTGGALGQVAVQELNMLQSVLGSLETAQSEDDLVAALGGIKQHFEGWKNAVRRSRMGGGASGGWSAREVK